MTDPIADMLTRIRNAAKIGKPEVFIPFSKLKLEIVKLFKREGFIEDFTENKKEDAFGGLVIKLKYDGKNSAITGINRISKPGRRVYLKKTDLPRVLNNLGVAIISTSGGIITNKEARKKGLGGEIICEIY